MGLNLSTFSSSSMSDESENQPGEDTGDDRPDRDGEGEPERDLCQCWGKIILNGGNHYAVLGKGFTIVVYD